MYRPIITGGGTKCIVNSQPKLWRGHPPAAPPPHAVRYRLEPCKICMVGSLPDRIDVITYAKFHVEIFRGYDFTGVEFPIFLLIFAWTLQHSIHNNCLICSVFTIYPPPPRQRPPPCCTVPIRTRRMVFTYLLLFCGCLSHSYSMLFRTCHRLIYSMGRVSK